MKSTWAVIGIYHDRKFENDILKTKILLRNRQTDKQMELITYSLPLEEEWN